MVAGGLGGEKFGGAEADRADEADRARAADERHVCRSAIKLERAPKQSGRQ